MKEIFSFCKPYMKGFRGFLCLLIGFSIIMSLASMVAPYITGQFIDKLLTSETNAFILRYVGLLVVLAIFDLFVSYICERIYIRVQIGSGYALNSAAIRHVQNVYFGFVQDKNTAFLNQQINNDANSVVIFCITVLQNIVTNCLSLAAPLVLIMLFEPWLGLCMLALNILYFIFYQSFRGLVYKADYALMEEQAEFFSKLDGQIDNVKFLQTHGIATSFIRRLDRSVKRLLGRALKGQKAEFSFNGTDIVIKTAANIAVFLLGGAAVVEKKMTVGELAIVMSYFSMSLSATQYFFTLGKSIQTNRVSCDRLQKIFEIQEQTNGVEQIDDIDTIVCADICFGYGDEMVLDHFDCSLIRGGMYAIIGDNGSGKSTLINLMLGLFIDKYTGNVFYNNKPIEEIDMLNVRRKLVGVTEQEPMLLEESLRFNITLDDDATLSEKEFSELSSILNLDSLLITLPDGLDTVVHEGSTNLSGGEKQKISILRALMKHPKLLVLDEPTSALDRISQEKLISYLQKTSADRITLISTHDKDLIRICTDVIHL